MAQNKTKSIAKSLEVTAVLGIIGIVSIPGKILADTADLKKYAPKKDLDIDAMFGTIQAYFFGAVVIACVFMILWGAFDIATAGGDENKLSGAKSRIKYAAIGLIVAAMASALVSLLLSITQVQETTFINRSC